jgi:predicted transcriptional regulator
VLTKGSGAKQTIEPPAVVFEKCLKELSNAKKNLSELMSKCVENQDQFYELEDAITEMIGNISDSITDDLKVKISPNLQILIDQIPSGRRGMIALGKGF